MGAQLVSPQIKHHGGGHLFVNSSHPNDVKKKGTQRSIRSHSIRGACRGRPSRRRKPQAVTYALERPYVAADTRSCPDQICEQIPVSKSLNLWPFPCELQPRAQELIYFMNAESDYVFRPFRAVWFSMALTDATAFQLCMANAAMFMAQRKQPETFQYEKCSETLEYYGKCLGQITKRLESRDDCASDGVIVTILGLICHDIYVGLWARWVTHIKGLRRIIELRGGYRNISSNLALWASWYDALGSATHDTCPQFPEYMCDLSPACQPVRTPRLEQIICKLIHKDYTPMQPILDALDRIREIADAINTHYQEPEFWRREDDLSPLQSIGPVTHALLSIPRLDAVTNDVVDPTELSREMVRLSMLILLAALKRMYSFFLDETEFTTLTAKFLSVLSLYRQNSSLYHDDGLMHLELWAILTVAALQPFANRWLYVTEIRRYMSYLDIQFATDAFQLSRDIAWIDVIGGTDMENESLINAIDNVTPPP
ncbi:hypothetical protein EYB26_008552 [Talaromyces marneffei]|uniref:uncharacterized protein n=1 Tax=Talaromyces marneffei TaxID=37727 RepID=UPI0012AA7C80|nr:uncharacterized protein EYB26_008552 [Talaromyces marneffei]QGA20842.1 hypothetical protein EYB26_008552 [Talaromyces marneffei]